MKVFQQSNALDLDRRARLRGPSPRAPRPSRAYLTRHLPHSPEMMEERVRIARDLHDSVAQTLYAITLNASRALRLIDRSETEELHRLVEDLMQLADCGQAEIRALLGNLRPACPAGLIQALRTVAADIQRRHPLTIRLALGSEPRTSPAVTEAVARIAQEALNNVARHAGCDHVDVALEAGPTELVLLICDAGRGFDPRVARPGHVGLHSMRERAEAVGGTLELISAEGQGTSVYLRVPRYTA